MSVQKKKDHKPERPDPKKQKAKELKPGLPGYLLPLCGIVLISLIAYLPVFHNGFVDWDDDKYIQNNSMLASFSLKEIFSRYVEGNYHPLTMLVYSIEYHFWGLSAGGYHAVNLLLHLLNVILVFYAVFLLSDKMEVALVASLLFGIHPMHVESVAWASELKDLLYSFFFLASYIFYLKYLSSTNYESNTNIRITNSAIGNSYIHNKFVVRRYYFYALLFFLLSLLSKAMAASLPVVLLLTDYFLSKKISLKMWIEKIPFFILSAVFGVVAIFAQGLSSSAIHFTFLKKVIFASYGFISYLIKLILPLRLSAFYPYPIHSGEAMPIQYYAYFTLLIVLLILVFYSLRFSKKIFFGIGFFAITVFLVLQILPVGRVIMADRYSYIPSIGIFYLAGERFYWLWKKKNAMTYLKPVAGFALAIVTVFFSVKTYSRCGIWKNSLILWSDVISQYKNVPLAYYNRGAALGDQRKYEEAIKDLNKAIELKPDYAEAYYNLGNAMRGQRKYEEAMKNYDKAIELKPDYIKAYNNRGAAWGDQRKYEEAIQNFNKAIELKPDYAEAYTNRGFALGNQRKYEEAMKDFNKALEIKPDYAEAYNIRGTSLGNQGKLEEAVKDFNKAIELKPDYAEAYNNRGTTWAYQKKYEEAIKDFNTAIKLKPDYSDAYNNLELALAGQKNMKKQ